MAEPVTIHVYIYGDEVAVRFESEAERVEKGREVFWRGGRALEIRTSGPCTETHVVRAIQDGYRRFREI